MPRNQSEKVRNAAHQAMLDCHAALSAYCARGDELDRNPASYSDSRDTKLHELRRAYTEAYTRMEHAGHIIGGSRNTYPDMRDQLAQEIEDRFGTKPK